MSAGGQTGLSLNSRAGADDDVDVHHYLATPADGAEFTAAITGSATVSRQRVDRVQPMCQPRTWVCEPEVLDDDGEVIEEEHCPGWVSSGSPQPRGSSFTERVGVAPQTEPLIVEWVDGSDRWPVIGSRSR